MRRGRKIGRGNKTGKSYTEGKRKRERGRGEGDRNSRRTGNCRHSGKKTMRK